MSSQNLLWTSEALENAKKRISAGKLVNQVPPDPNAIRSTLSDPPKKKPFARARQHKRHVSGVMNDLEKRFNDEWVQPRILSGELVDYWFEEWTFKLADGCRYTPDFVVQDKEGFLYAYECKPTIRDKKTLKQKPLAMDDSIVKIKVSPMRFPLQFFIAHPEHKSTGTGWHIIEK